MKMEICGIPVSLGFILMMFGGFVMWIQNKISDWDDDDQDDSEQEDKE